jgi:S-(hydroxymethyl)glutathione dehydrogenase/alcohol dehydrogenase
MGNSTVRAAVLHEYGKPLDIEEIDLAPTPPGHVRVQIAASGLCHSDLSVMQGKFPFPVPAVLGHEGAGVVMEVGDGVTRVRPGDHVVLNWNPGCGDCALCRLGETHLCVNAALWTFGSPYGSVRGEPVFRGLGTATFATETLTVEGAVVPIDEQIPLDVAALVGCAITTGVGAVVNTAKVRAGSTVAVVGCGGVGLSVVMGARYAGAERIIAIDLSAERRAIARSLGATDEVDGADGVQAVLDLTDGLGVDYAFEVVGVPLTMQLAWGITRRGGTTVAVGAGSADESTSFSMFDLFFQSRTLIGCVYGSADPDRDFPRFLGMWRDGQLPIDRLVTERITLDQINDGFEAMQAGEGARSVIINS